ncbi:MAG TPA: diguanylate cyclase [Rhodanobacteraceae bacterium]
MESEISRTRLVERVFRLRAFGLGLGLVAVAGVFLDHGMPPWAWTLLAIEALLWPHLARQFALHGTDPERAEVNNLLIDSAMGGVWIALMQFSIVPSALLVVMLAVDKISVGGWRLLGHAFALQVAACALTAAANGFAFEPESSMRSILLSLPFLAAYPLAIAAATFALARRASRHNRMLARQTRVDAATGLLNRPSWEAAVENELRRFKRGGASASLMMIDIDHFKTINDRYGHLAGDEVIRIAAAVIQSCIREMDVPGRYGGDEFGLLLVHTGTHAALVAAERIRQRLAETAFERAPDVRCTLSIGIASATLAMEDVHAWISEADAALYQAKTQGRNRIVRL